MFEAAQLIGAGAASAGVGGAGAGIGAVFAGLNMARHSTKRGLRCGE